MGTDISRALDQIVGIQHLTPCKTRVRCSLPIAIAESAAKILSISRMTTIKQHGCGLAQLLHGHCRLCTIFRYILLYTVHQRGTRLPRRGGNSMNTAQIPKSNRNGNCCVGAIIESRYSPSFWLDINLAIKFGQFLSPFSVR